MPRVPVHWYFPVSFMPESSREMRPQTCFLRLMESSTSVSCSAPGRSFMDTSRDCSRFICSSPCSRRRIFKRSPSLRGTAFRQGSLSLPSAYRTCPSLPGNMESRRTPPERFCSGTITRLVMYPLSISFLFIRDTRRSTSPAVILWPVSREAMSSRKDNSSEGLSNTTCFT